MNAADISVHEVKTVTIEKATTHETATGEFTARYITICKENGTTVTVQLFAKGDELKVEIQ
jgi:hypothetical protein